MYYTFFILLCLFIKTISPANIQCSSLNSKLHQYKIEINNQEKSSSNLRICQGLIEDICCPQIYEEKIQNATAIELYHLFEFYSKRLYKPLVRLTIQFNETMNKLIELSRNATHSILEDGFQSYYHFYRPSIDEFYNQFFRMSSRNFQHHIKNNFDEFFRNILRLSIGLSDEKKPIAPSYLICLWRNHPFGNRPNLIANKFEIYLGKLFHYNELFKLSIELIEVMSTSVTTDYHCIDSFMQLSYCNLCSGREELPCPSNCANVIESCLVNVTLINDVWMKFIDSLGNIEYFNGIEKVFSSIGKSISDALMTFFHSDELLNKDIIDQCGSIRIRKEIYNLNQQYPDQHISSLLDSQLVFIRQTLEIYRPFWLILPKEICQLNELSSSKDKSCWTGNSISQDKNRESIRIHYDKPLSLRLQWILKEMKEKSQIIGGQQGVSTGMLKNSLLFNLTENFDDYPTDEEFDYSDYAYEDLPIVFTTATPTTTTQSSSILLDDEINTVSYYDYGEQDVYNDDELNETLTRQSSSIPPSTTTTTIAVMRIPSYHQRQPVIWNIQIDNEDFHLSNSSSSVHSSFLIFFFFIFLFT